MSSRLHIGIDLDNTILEYVPLFHQLGVEQAWIEPECLREKGVIKQALIQHAGGDAEEGERRWQQLQAWVYGHEIHRAKVFPGFRDFVHSLRNDRARLSIVSHKSETSHFDTTVRLREHAMDTLQRRDFFRSVCSGGLGFCEKDIYFESDRKAKAARIKSLGCTHFIDDLPAVLLHPGVPSELQPLLIGSLPGEGLPRFASWLELIHYFSAVHALREHRLNHWLPLTGGGNNRLYHLGFENKPDLVLKIYWQDPNDDRPRQQAEWCFLRYLSKHLPDQAPIPVSKWEGGCLMSKVPGQRPSDTEPSTIRAIETFLAGLAAIDDHQIGDLVPAAHARFRLGTFIEHFEARFEKTQVAVADDPVLFDLLTTKIRPLANDARNRFIHVCHSFGLNPESPIPQDYRFPSPSDLGPHNALVDETGNTRFLDFEYAGWDDPAKMLADFYHHVGHQITRHQRLSMVNKFIAHRIHDEQLRHRFLAVCDLVGVEWILIVLNVVHREVAARKRFAGGSRALFEKRIQKAREMCDGFQSIAEVMPVS